MKTVWLLLQIWAKTSFCQFKNLAYTACRKYNLLNFLMTWYRITTPRKHSRCFGDVTRIFLKQMHRDIIHFFQMLISKKVTFWWNRNWKFLFLFPWRKKLRKDLDVLKLARRIMFEWPEVLTLYDQSSLTNSNIILP